MGHFSNGTEGMMYEEKYCAECVNFREYKDTGSKHCAVLDAHFIGNDDQFTGEFNRGDIGTPKETKTPRYKTEKEMELAKTLRRVLGLLIPIEGAYNGKCKMFLDYMPQYVDPNQMELFEEDK